jgi:BirA family biotin operon repressor/biotin-[acetyl-CoA-carboxylase] ligase
VNIDASGHVRPAPPELARALGRLDPSTAEFVKDVRYFESVGSTNDEAAQLAAAGAPEGTVVIARQQTAGRGRRGRQWHSAPGAGIYMSLVLRPRTSGAGASGGDAALITLMAGAAAAEAVEAAEALRVALKWPNDLVVERDGRGGVERRKLAGILAEGAASAAGLQHVVLGIGINLRPTAYLPELADRVTSIERETGRPADGPRLVAELLRALARGRHDLLEGRTGDVLERWRARGTASVGRLVRWHEGDRVLEGTTAGIDDSGALLVDSPRGRDRIVAGELTWR